MGRRFFCRESVARPASMLLEKLSFSKHFSSAFFCYPHLISRRTSISYAGRVFTQMLVIYIYLEGMVVISCEVWIFFMYIPS